MHKMVIEDIVYDGIDGQRYRVVKYTNKTAK